MKFLLVSAVVLASALSAQAEVAPQYRDIRVIDAAIEAMRKSLKMDSVDSVPISSIKVSTDMQKVTVTTHNQTCEVDILKKQALPHMIGGSNYSGKVITACEKLSDSPRVLLYEKISDRLSKEAAKSKRVNSVEVTKTGKLVLAFKTGQADDDSDDQDSSGGPSIEPGPLMEIEDEGTLEIANVLMDVEAKNLTEFMAAGNTVTDITQKNIDLENTQYVFIRKQCAKGGIAAPICLGGARLSVSVNSVRKGSMVITTTKSTVTLLK